MTVARTDYGDRLHGASWTVNRSGGHRAAAHAKKSAVSSSSAVCCSWLRTIHGRLASCSVTVKVYVRTNVCSQP